MSEEKEKPLIITFKATIPIRDIMSVLKQMFPFIEVSIEEEKKPTEIPSKVITPDENVNNPEALLDYPPRPLFEISPASLVCSWRPMTDPLGVPPKASPEEEKKPEEAPPAKPEG